MKKSKDNIDLHLDAGVIINVLVDVYWYSYLRPVILNYNGGRGKKITHVRQCNSPELGT